MEAAVVAVALAIAAAAERAGDRATLMEAPEKVAESFGRSLVEKRWKPAAGRLQHPPAEPGALLALERAITRRAGPIQRLQATRIAMDPVSARAEIEFRGARAAVTLEATLRWERGRWAIAAWDGPR